MTCDAQASGGHALASISKRPMAVSNLNRLITSVACWLLMVKLFGRPRANSSPVKSYPDGSIYGAVLCSVCSLYAGLVDLLASIYGSVLIIAIEQKRMNDLY